MKLGEHDVLDIIGRGGMGVVVTCRAPGGPLRAAKLIHPLVAERAGVRARFEREIRLLKKLGESEGFVPLIETGEHPEAGTYMIMPYLEGGTLEARLARAPLPVNEVLALGRALAAALGRAHALGIVHRDMKPTNVLFGSDGRPLIADLGLGKHFRRDVLGASQSQSLSLSGETRGTFQYMPPEQMEDASKVGPEADVFSLGAMLYELLAGALPDPAYKLAVSGDDLGKRLRDLRPEAPVWLAAAVARCLEARPGERFADGAALLRALQAPRTRPVGVVVLLSAIVVAAGAALALGVAKRRSPPPPLLPVTATDDTTDLIARSEAEAKLQHWDAAAGLATRAIGQRPSAEAFSARAFARNGRGDIESALADANEAIRLAPSKPLGWLRRAEIRRRQQEYDGALADLERAGASGELARVYAERAYVRHEQHDDRGAIEDATKALKLDPRDPTALHVRASAYLLVGDFKGASEDARLGTELDPTDSGAWTNLSGAKIGLRDYDGAIEAANRAIELGPKSHVFAWLYRCEAHWRKSQLDEALADAEAAVEHFPGHPAALKVRDDVKRLMSSR